MEIYPIPLKQVVYEEVIKNSRFITILMHFDDPDSIKSILTNVRSEYPDARHYCWAYQAGQPGSSLSIGASDDGEPAGSAGRPMLAALLGADVGEVLAVSIRYFGGVKLGVGGLVRAYGGGVKQALTLLETQSKRILKKVIVKAGYADVDSVNYLIKEYDGEIGDTTYGDEVVITCLMLESSIKQFSQHLINLTHGRVQARFEQKKTN